MEMVLSVCDRKQLRKNVNRTIAKAKQKIKEADVILITAGAGMGVDSGLPDFRGDEGFWKAYPVIKNLGHSFVDMANPPLMVSFKKLG